jgi:hypothetical protein
VSAGDRRVAEEAEARSIADGFKARPVPLDTAQFKLDMSAQKKKAPTEFAPFNLVGNRRHEEATTAFKAQVAQEAAKAASDRVFRAKPIMATDGAASNSSIQSVTDGENQKPKTLTEFAPFRGVTEHSRAMTAHKDNAVKDIVHAEKEKAGAFKAQPVPFSLQHQEAVFKVAKSKVALTELKPFQLNSDSRSSARQEYEALKQERSMENTKAAELQRKREALKEAKALRDYRKGLEFKAQPIKGSLGGDSAPAENKPAKTLTVPESPALFTKRRAAMAAEVHA